MNIDIKRVSESDRYKLENLLQLYLHELSYYFPADYDPNTCTYKYNIDKYFKDNYAYFITMNNNIYGFILLDDNKNHNYEISEIFVVNAYKFKKIGEIAVNKIFDKYHGNWTIKAVPSSPLAEAFWDKTISNYTKDYRKENTGKYNRAEYCFSN